MFVCPLCRIALASTESVCPRDGQHGQEASLHPIAEVLAKRFHVLEPFAHGRGGSLYLADEPESGRRGLLKVMGPAPRNLQAERQRLRRELVKQATLDSAHIVIPLSTGESDGGLWIFRGFFEGVSLRARLARDGALPQAEALAISAQLAIALDELHRAGLLHRDLKPGHVLLQTSAQGPLRVALIDAGLCSPLLAAEQPGEGLVLGTPGYVAPEALAGKLVSFRSDLYALGCVMFEMLTGRPAFAGDSPEAIVAAQRAGELPSMPDGLPQGVASLLRSLLAKDPQERPFSAQKLRRTLDPFLMEGASVTKQPMTTSEKSAEPRKPAVPQPTGTHSKPPPPPPTTRNSVSRVPPITAEVRAPVRSSIPPPPQPSGKLKEEKTQVVDLGQIVAVAQIAVRASVPPPPRPGVGKAPDPTEALDLDSVLEVEVAPGAAPASPAPDQRAPEAALPPLAERPREAPAPRPNADHTQPIRLEQVLAVADSRKQRASVPPIKADGTPRGPAPVIQPAEPAIAVVPTQAVGADVSAAQTIAREPAGAPANAGTPNAFFGAPLAPAAAPPAAAPEPAPDASDGDDRTIVDQEDRTIDVTLAELATVTGMPSTAVDSVAPSDDAAEDEGEPGEEEATSVTFRPAAASMARVKKTLRGTGVPLDLAAAQSAATPALTTPDGTPLATPGSVHAAMGASFAADEAGADDSTAELLSRPDYRRWAPYAAAAVVLLGVVIGVSALVGGEDEADRAVAALEKPAEPAAADQPAAAASGTPAVTPLAEAPKEPVPTAQPIAQPEPVAEPIAKAEAAPSEAVVEAIAQPAEAADSEPSKASSERERRRDRRESKREERTSKSSAKNSAKSGGSKKSADKTELWTEAREEARQHWAAKRYKQAAQSYEQAARYNPTHAGTFAGLGAARLQLGDTKGAIQAYQKAVDLSPSTSGFHAALGKAYLAKGDKTRARSAYKRALALDPKNDSAKTALKQLGA